jgi:hypothetical protein
MLTAAGVALVLISAANPGRAQDHDETVVTSAPPVDEAVTDPPVADKHELLRRYVLSAIGPPGAIRATIMSGLDQWRDVPMQWESGWDGYAKRWVSDFSESAIGDTTMYAVARLLHEDPSFVPCTCTETRRRIRHAVVSPFLARKRDGTYVLSPAIVAEVASDHLVASTWYPDLHRTRYGLTHTGIGLLSTIGVNVLKEFVMKHRKEVEAAILKHRP